MLAQKSFIWLTFERAVGRIKCNRVMEDAGLALCMSRAEECRLDESRASVDGRSDCSAGSCLAKGGELHVNTSDVVPEK